MLYIKTMKKILFALVVLTMFGCKKNEEPTPEPKNVELEIYFKTDAPTIASTNYYINYDNSIVKNEKIPTNPYTFKANVKSGKFLSTSLSNLNGSTGYRATVIVIYDRDTIFNNTKFASTGTTIQNTEAKY